MIISKHLERANIYGWLLFYSDFIWCGCFWVSFSSSPFLYLFTLFISPMVTFTSSILQTIFGNDRVCGRSYFNWLWRANRVSVLVILSRHIGIHIGFHFTGKKKIIKMLCALHCVSFSFFMIDLTLSQIMKCADREKNEYTFHRQPTH